MLCLAPVHLALLRRACSAFSRKSQIVQPAKLGACLYLKQKHWSAASWKPATETGHQASCLPFQWPGTWTANSPVSSPQLEFRQGTQMETAYPYSAAAAAGTWWVFVATDCSANTQHQEEATLILLFSAPHKNMCCPSVCPPCCLASNTCFFESLFWPLLCFRVSE